MTRFLLVPFPLHGHVWPMVALAAELTDRGDEVHVVVSRPFADAFADVGGIVSEIEFRTRSAVPEKPTLRHRAGRFRMLWDVYREQVRLTEQLTHDWPEWNPAVVVSDIMSIWGVRAAEAKSVPFASFYVTYAVSEQVLIDDVARRLGPRMAALVRRTGLARHQPAVRRRATAGAALALVNAIPELQPARDSFDARYHFVGPLRRGFEPRGETDLPWDRIEAGPTLFVSTGTYFTRGPEFFGKVARAFAGSEWFVVMATSHTDPDALGALPANVVARRYVPQSAVLAHCDAFISHAGMNSAMEGLALGVPMVLVPRASDQREIAGRLERLGAGTVIGSEAPAEEIREAVRRVCADNAVRTALAKWSGRLGGWNGPAAAADALQHLAANGSGASRHTNSPLSRRAADPGGATHGEPGWSRT